jgi:hypothetical protein
VVLYDLQLTMHKQLEDAMPELLKSPSIHWNKETLFEFAKASFRNFKSAWMAQVDEDKARKKRANERTNRWLGRRREVSARTIDTDTHSKKP